MCVGGKVGGQVSGSAGRVGVLGLILYAMT